MNEKTFRNINLTKKNLSPISKRAFYQGRASHGSSIVHWPAELAICIWIQLEAILVIVNEALLHTIFHYYYNPFIS